jgi:hypothetical protein
MSQDHQSPRMAGAGTEDGHRSSADGAAAGVGYTIRLCKIHSFS